MVAWKKTPMKTGQKIVLILLVLAAVAGGIYYALHATAA